MIRDPLKLPLCLNQRIRPSDDTVIASEVNLTGRAHGNRRQRKEGDASAVFSLQIRYGRLCRIRILRDDIPHTPAESHVNCREITLRDANEIGDRSRDAAPPPLRRLQDGLHIPPEALIAVLYPPLKVKILSEAKELRIRLSKLCLAMLNHTAQFLNVFIKTTLFLRYALQILFGLCERVIFALTFCLCLHKGCATTLDFLLPTLLALIPLLRSIPRNCKPLPQARQYTLYGCAR